MTEVKKKGLGQAPSLDEPKNNNLTKQSPATSVMVTFSVPSEFRKELKFYSTSKDMTMGEVLKKSFEFYRKQNP
jgi:hypothetical protein